ncbi:MAG TPA: phosphatase PAP2 family protein, partial [Kofleriaceae bacterium]|nr:phosphatase PAP2 family protein [Kofleriaceae bacterium]
GGSIRGGVFPSAHVSASTAWALIAWRAHRKSGAVVAVLAAGIAVATVYLGFHHAVDAVAGIALGSACVVLGRWWLGRRGEAGA